MFGLCQIQNTNQYSVETKSFVLIYFCCGVQLISSTFPYLINVGCFLIGCFVCKSYNGSDPSCEDTFNSTVQQGTNFSLGKNKYLNPCWAEKLHHRGDNPKSTMVIRTCALDSGTLTADTEIVRISSCSPFKFRGKQYNGCVQSCDTDGCNGTSISKASFILFLSIFLVLLTLFNDQFCS
uniref:Protein quiver n=1 Tax=Syphacia muris TaxID=451379 RepID=A0A0N5B000_9BILA